MATFWLYLELDNAAFDDPQELARILRKVADSPDIASNCRAITYVPLRDINGNTVGSWEIDEDQ